MSETDILRHQIDYYRARAAEYDEWFYRQGRYDKGKEINDKWFAEAAIVRQALYDIGPVDRALELAPGTGIWTQELIRLAQQVTALDASAEMIAINQQKLGSPAVTYAQVDLFEWEPEAQYDLIFFSFWLSHVPPEKLDPFLGKVHRALRTGGKAFMIDSRQDATSIAVDHQLPDEGIIHTRKLNDGREFNIVKIFYEPEELRQIWERNGFNVQAEATDTFFIYALATPR